MVVIIVSTKIMCANLELFAKIIFKLIIMLLILPSNFLINQNWTFQRKLFFFKTVFREFVFFNNEFFVFSEYCSFSNNFRERKIFGLTNNPIETRT